MKFTSANRIQPHHSTSGAGWRKTVMPAALDFHSGLGPEGLVGDESAVNPVDAASGGGVLPVIGAGVGGLPLSAGWELAVGRTSATPLSEGSGSYEDTGVRAPVAEISAAGEAAACASYCMRTRPGRTRTGSGSA